MERPSRLPLIVGVLLIACGWAVIGIAWWQAGRQELQTGQIPYVLSGGFGGLGLILVGAAGVLVDAIQGASWRSQRSSQELRQTMDGVREAIEAQIETPSEPEAEPEEQARPRRRKASGGGRNRPRSR